jgi:hypothetical protein
VVAELAMHPNIVGMKDSSGNVERIAELVKATRSARKRTVPVTTVFAAVTSRMLSSQAGRRDRYLRGRGAAWSPGRDGCGRPQARPLKTRTREVGFQVLCGSAQTLYPSLEAGATGGVLALASFAPQACWGEVYMAWAEKDGYGGRPLAAEKQQRIVRAGIEVCGQMGIPGVKYALDLNGYYGGRPRMPLLPVDREEQRQGRRADGRIFVTKLTTLYQPVAERVDPVPDPPVEPPPEVAPPPEVVPELELPEETTGPTTTPFVLSFVCHVEYSAASICRVMGLAVMDGFAA